ncbi:MAG: hypothetical protein FJ207_08445 [Gemmatimonadetes bacterium]|nr:hypothetical protein [Gemmatimonadota bacterium]
MRRFDLMAVAAVTLAACDTGTEPPVLDTGDYALVLFGDPGVVLETTFGPQTSHAYDGRTQGPGRLPAELALTTAQKEQISALRQAFKAARASQLAALKAVMERAKAARAAGQTREEVRAIMVEARPIAQSLRAAVLALYQSVLGVLTAEQKAWLEANRPARRGS